MFRPAIIPLTLTMLLSGCGLMSVLGGEPNRDMFELRAPDTGSGRCGRGQVAEVVVELPKSRGSLDSERIMIRPSPLQTAYLPDAIWGDPVPAMLQGLLVETLSRNDAFSHVGRAPLGIGGDYALISEIRAFNAETVGEGALVRLEVDAQMVREMDASVASRGQFSATAEAAGTRPDDLIPAFDAAGQQLLGEMNAWALRAIGVNPESCR